MNVASYILSNWVVILLSIAALGVLVVKIINFVKKPSEQQIAALKEWLKLAVTEAEAELGSGTGQLKLRAVYEMAVETFPWVEKFVAFETFSTWVDEALDWMNAQLETNENVKAYVVDGTITPIEVKE